MNTAPPSRANTYGTGTSAALHLLTILFTLLLTLAATAQTNTPTFQITGATFGTTGITSIPAGVPGGTFLLTGTLPTAATQAQNPVNACFYTGYGSTTAFPTSLPNGTNTEPLTVPASTIQSIPNTAFTATNNFAVTGYLYFVVSGGTCTGTFDATLTNRFPVTILAPSIYGYTGPTSIPQTNTATALASPPTYLSFNSHGILTNGQYGASTSTTVSFGNFGTVTSDLPNGILHIPVPAAFSSSPVGTTASLTLCNNFGTVSTCTTPGITLTVTALAASNGTLTATPTPVTTAGQTTVAATFAKTNSSTADAGAPSGTVTFTAGGKTLPPASLILDQTATFTTQTSTLTVPTTPTPTITPAAGSYLNSVTVTLADTTSNAPIFYTQDGTAPSSSATPYTAPFQITTSQTIQAIAIATGSLPSAVASAAYTITVSTPAGLAFVVQPVNTATGTFITPAVQVAIQDASGNTVNNSTLPVTLALANNSSGATLGGTLTVNAVNGIATFPDLTVDNISTGYALVATSGSLTRATSSTFNITAYPITMAVQSALIGINSTLTGTVTLGHAAPVGGLAVTLSSDTPTNVTIAPSTLTIAAGQTTGSFTYTGVASGNATLSAAATNYQTGTVQVTGTAAQVSLSTIPTAAPGQSVSVALSLPTPAPAGGTTVTFTSSNTGVATVTPSIMVPAGQRTASTNPQVTGVTIGTANILASAPGFAPASLPATVTVTPSINPTTTYLNLTTSTNTSLNISAPAQAGGLTFTLSSDDPAIATVPASVTIPAGSTKVNLPITGVASGTTTIRADSPGVTEATGTVNVQSNITVNPATTGVLMLTSDYIGLPVAPSSPITVTVTSSNPAIATLSTSTTAVGTASVTFTNITSTNVGYVYLQGQTAGSVTLTVSAPGYTAGTATGTVDAGGFTFYYYQGDYSATTYDQPSSTTLYTAVYDANNNFANIGLQLNPGIADVSVPVTSSNTSVGTISGSPVVFHAGDTSHTFNFQPVAAGTTNILIGTPPPPFTPATQYNKRTVTVSAPVIQSTSTYTGVNLSSPINIYLPVTPPNPVTVTVTSSGPGLATISSSPTTVGTTSLTFANIASTYVGTVYVQGIAPGNTTLTTAAPGYTSGTTTVTVYPTGFIINPYQGNFSNNTTDSPPNIYVYPAILDPNNQSVVTYGLTVSPGVAPISVPFTSSSTAVGTLTPTSLVFNPGDTSKYSTFQPLAAGTTTLALGTPTGYTTPSGNQSVVATVTNPNRSISLSPVTTGVNLETSTGIYLSTASTTPLTVTVTSSAPSVASVSNLSTTVGTASTTFTVAANSTYVGTVFIQGLAQGTTNITASATGYTSGSGVTTVDPSGFSYSYYGPASISTTTFSQPTAIAYYPAVLDPSSLGVINYGLPLNPGAASVSVPITNSATQVGTLSPTTLFFNPGDTYKQTSFQPVAAGSTTLTIGTPSGYSTPSNYTVTSVNVTAPAISVSDVETGVNLGNRVYIYLPQNPPNPVTITVTSNGPGIASIAKNATDVGVATLTFPNITSTNGFYIYVQGLTLGATTITVSAPGYTNGTSNVTVDPAGFTFLYNTSFSTATAYGPYNLTVYPCSLTPGTLTLISCGLYVSPGLGTIAVPVTNSNPAVGTSTTPVNFAPGDTSDVTTFTPLSSGTTVLTLGTPAGYSTPSQDTQSTATVQ